MSRLTYKKDNEPDWLVYDLYYIDTQESIYCGEAVDKLARYEDIGEPEELEKIVNGAQKYLSARNGGKQALKDLICASELREENEQLKQQLAEKNKLLENTIVPKFKVGDVLWYIRCDKVEKFIVYEARCDCVFYYVNEDGVDVDEYKLFATKQEAEEALEELK